MQKQYFVINLDNTELAEKQNFLKETLNSDAGILLHKKPFTSIFENFHFEIFSKTNRTTHVEESFF